MPGGKIHHLKTVPTPRPARRARYWVPRGLRRAEAAAYLGISPGTFDTWVEEGVMPQAIRRRGIVVWDREALDAAFDALAQSESASGSGNSFDD